ncbi:MAG: UDP-N-acetylmuramate--L-alanine ligase [Planctomycetota bacterium]|nr:MAG: UDP-N-acetylmuramate--L-alanine ligase [Planctomycetota bacterium]
MGAGGIGVSALIRLAMQQGAMVSGCDLVSNKITQTLSQLNVPVEIGHSPDHIKELDLLVYSSAVAKNNLEMQFAHEMGVECISRSQMLTRLQIGSKTIGITGSHGKTSTTNILSHILIESAIDVSVAVGGISEVLGNKNFKLGSSEWFVSELDESDGSMLDAECFVGVLTNIDKEHIDYYGSMNDLVDAFSRFCENINKEGCLVINFDDIYCQKIISRISSNIKIITYGLHENADYRIVDEKTNNFSSMFELSFHGKSKQVSIPLAGVHNAMNTVAALIVAEQVGVQMDPGINSLVSYRRIRRRLDILYKEGPIVIDDYSHHPTEIEVVLKACRESVSSRIVAIFQAHRYSRLQSLWPEFVDALSSVDELILTDIYSANEKPLEGITVDKLAKAILDNSSIKVQYIPDFDNIVDYINSTFQTTDLIISLGAGDVNYITKKIAKILKSNDS